MGAAAKVTEIYTENSNTIPVAKRTREYLEVKKMTIGDLAREINYARATLNLYLTGKQKSAALESKLASYLDEQAMDNISDKTPAITDKPIEQTEQPRPPARKRGRGNTPRKTEFFESSDARLVIGVCQSCQEYNEMGILTGRSGFGKTFALKEYAKLPRVAYIECDVTMGTRDLLKEIEKALGIPHHTYSSNRERVNSIVDFLSINKGWLIIVDEADKLMSKNTQNKMDMLRAIFDRTSGDTDYASCGIVIAGQPKLEALIKTYLEQYAKRTLFGAKLQGLSVSEVRGFLKGHEIEESALAELINRAQNPQTGCFRLLERTMRNVIRMLNESGEQTVTLKTIEQASSLMML